MENLVEIVLRGGPLDGARRSVPADWEEREFLQFPVPASVTPAGAECATYRQFWMVDPKTGARWREWHHYDSIWPQGSSAGIAED